MIVIVEYGQAGNMLAIKNMINKIGYDCVISGNHTEINEAEKLILPGVGSFDSAMNGLINRNLKNVLINKARGKTPILGICLGMQILAVQSEEGILDGLGLIEAEFKKIPKIYVDTPIKSPHLGWNKVYLKSESKLFGGIPDPRFYFVHSYYCIPMYSDLITGETEYGFRFCSFFEKENVLGVQFHPEKSHSFGKQLLKNFIEKY